MKLATAVNQYLDQTAPWTEIKTDREAAAKTIYTALESHRLAQGDVRPLPAVHIGETAQFLRL